MKRRVLVFVALMGAACTLTPAQRTNLATGTNKVLSLARSLCRLVGMVPDVPLPDAGAAPADASAPAPSSGGSAP